MRDRLPVPALLQQDIAKIVVRFRKVRPAKQCKPAMLCCFLHVACNSQGITQSIVGFRGLRLKTDGLSKTFQCLSHLAQC